MSESKFIVFELANELYGIPIDAVERILPDQSITKLPRTPEMFLGVFDLRGETIPAIDLRKRFDFDPWENEANFIVVITKLGRCALRVDGVDGIVTLDDKNIDEAGDLLKHKGDDFISGIGKNDDKLIVLVVPNNIIPADLREEVASAAQEPLAEVAA